MGLYVIVVLVPTLWRYVYMRLPASLGVFEFQLISEDVSRGKWGTKISTLGLLYYVKNVYLFKCILFHVQSSERVKTVF